MIQQFNLIWCDILIELVEGVLKSRLAGKHLIIYFTTMVILAIAHSTLQAKSQQM